MQLITCSDYLTVIFVLLSYSNSGSASTSRLSTQDLVPIPTTSEELYPPIRMVNLTEGESVIFKDPPGYPIEQKYSHLSLTVHKPYSAVFKVDRQYMNTYSRQDVVRIKEYNSTLRLSYFERFVGSGRMDPVTKYWRLLTKQQTFLELTFDAQSKWATDPNKGFLFKVTVVSVNDTDACFQRYDIDKMIRYSISDDDIQPFRFRRCEWQFYSSQNKMIQVEVSSYIEWNGAAATRLLIYDNWSYQLNPRKGLLARIRPNHASTNLWSTNNQVAIVLMNAYTTNLNSLMLRVEIRAAKWMTNETWTPWYTWSGPAGNCGPQKRFRACRLPPRQGCKGNQTLVDYAYRVVPCNCSAKKWQCALTKKCISTLKRCNKNFDCRCYYNITICNDKSDEDNCWKGPNLTPLYITLGVLAACIVGLCKSRDIRRSAADKFRNVCNCQRQATTSNNEEPGAERNSEDNDTIYSQEMEIGDGTYITELPDQNTESRSNSSSSSSAISGSSENPNSISDQEEDFSAVTNTASTTWTMSGVNIAPSYHDAVTEPTTTSVDEPEVPPPSYDDVMQDDAYTLKESHRNA